MKAKKAIVGMLVAAVLAGMGTKEAAAQAPAQATRTMLMGSLEILTNPAGQLQQWRRFSRKYADEKAVYALCSTASLCSPVLRRWRELLVELREAPAFDRLDAVNRYVNDTVTYRPDNWVPGKKDQWASPLETLENGGDCEDIAILKYVSLLELGFSEDQLRLVVLKDRALGRGHAVLSVRLRGGLVVVLDNLSLDLVPEDRLARYEPIYSVSGERRWMYLRIRSTPAAISQ